MRDTFYMPMTDGGRFLREALDIERYIKRRNEKTSRAVVVDTRDVVDRGDRVDDQGAVETCVTR
jgi:hypothetical protein